MATDGTNLVFLNGYAQAFIVPVAGGTPVALAPAPTGESPGHIAIANGVVAWTNYDSNDGVALWKSSTAANSGAYVASDIAGDLVPTGLVLDASGTNAYVQIESPGTQSGESTGSR